ncbi:hypothetical protein GCM10018952_69910 [Streptosporangium vulgare]
MRLDDTNLFPPVPGTEPPPAQTMTHQGGSPEATHDPIRERNTANYRRMNSKGPQPVRLNGSWTRRPRAAQRGCASGDTSRKSPALPITGRPPAETGAEPVSRVRNSLWISGE